MVRKGWIQSHGQSRPGNVKDGIYRRIRAGYWHMVRHLPANPLYHGIEVARQTGTIAFNTLLPERCGLCLVPDNGGYCRTCQGLLPWIGSACQLCAASLDVPGVCGQCQKRLGQKPGPVSYDHLMVPFRYQPPIANHIQQLKYHQQLAMVPVLAKMLALNVLSHSTPLPEVLIPVPLHPARLRKRGFNQAALIANETGRLLQIPVDHKLLIRQRNTRSQTNLDEAARATNLRDAFAVTGKRRYDAVAVIDDVITSGATIGSACKTLSRDHRCVISAWAIAKT